jgi:hypothetical protein
MNIICCSPLRRPDVSAFGSLQISESTRTRLNARSSAEISLTTADGDKVTLSAGSSLRAEHITYDFLGRVQGQTVSAHAEKLQISTSTAAAATVQGALDEEELDDIKRLLDVLETTAGDFLSGKSDGLSPSLAEMGDLDSIASFEAALSYSREASAERTRNITSTTQAAPASAAGIAATDAPAMPRSAESFLERLTALAENLEDEKVIDTLPRRFTQLFKKLAKTLSLDEREQKLLDRIQSEYLKRS